jgi:hypothetical protein
MNIVTCEKQGDEYKVTVPTKEPVFPGGPNYLEFFVEDPESEFEAQERVFLYLQEAIMRRSAS